MQSVISLLALGASLVSAQQSLSPLDPPGSIIKSGLASDCSLDAPGYFTIQTTNVSSSASSKRVRSLSEVLGFAKRQSTPSCGKSVVTTLKGGLLLDSQGRTGYIASNGQYQFDGPPQAPDKGGEIIVGSWGYCSGSKRLALGDQQIFYNCLSGTFNNLYNETLGGQCYQVYIGVVPCQPTGSVVTTQVSLTSPAGEMTDGQVSSTSSSSATSSPSSAAATTTGSSSVPTAASTMPTVFPAGNSTVVSSSVAVVSTPATTAATTTLSTAAAPATTSAGTSASSFKGAANVVAVGQGVAAMAAAAGAFFML